MVNYYVNNTGFAQPFALVEADGETPINLTLLTVTWYFKDYSTTPATIKSIIGTVTNAALGLCSFSVPASFFTAVATYSCQIVITSGSSNISTDPPFTVQILVGSNA